MIPILFKKIWNKISSILSKLAKSTKDDDDKDGDIPERMIW